MVVSRTELLRDFGEWIAFITDLGRFNEQIWNQSIAPGKWSVREVTAHILQWDHYFYENAVSILGSSLPLTLKHLNYDTFNEDAKIYGKSVSVPELVQKAVQIRMEILKKLTELTDEQFEVLHMDADGQPFQAAQYVQDFIWHDQHHINQIKKRLHFRIEEMSLNGWPALQTMTYDGWLLRFSEGYTKRSNSINPIYGHQLELDSKISECEQLYTNQQLRTVFKITPFAHPFNLDEKLNDRAYEKIDHTLVKTIHLEDVIEPAHSDIWIEEQVSESWLDAVTAFSELNEQQRIITRKMMERSPLVKCFAVLHENGIPVACGLAVIEQGWIGLYDIVTDPSKRGCGYGEQLVLNILDWGKKQGATEGYLLVVKDNAPANRLYDKIGYSQRYDYWYRVQAD